MSGSGVSEGRLAGVPTWSPSNMPAPVDVNYVPASGTVTSVRTAVVGPDRDVTQHPRLHPSSTWKERKEFEMRSMRCLLGHRWKRRRRLRSGAEGTLPPGISIAHLRIEGHRPSPLTFLLWTECGRCGLRAVSTLLVLALMWAAAPAGAAERLSADLHARVVPSEAGPIAALLPRPTNPFLRVPLLEPDSRNGLGTDLPVSERKSSSPLRRGTPRTDRARARSCTAEDARGFDAHAAAAATSTPRPFASLCILRW